MTCGHDQNAALAAKTSRSALLSSGQLDAQRRADGSVKADADADIGDEGADAELIERRRDHPGVVEERHVECQSARDPPELAGGQDGMPIAKAPTAVAAQSAAAPERWQQKYGT